MNPLIYYFLHIFSVLLLTGLTLYIAANPMKHTKGKMMAVTGILSLIVLVAGFGLVAKVHANDWLQGWLIVKIVAWLFISALAGMAYRKSKSFVVSGVILASGIAIYMAYMKPF